MPRPKGKATTTCRGRIQSDCEANENCTFTKSKFCRKAHNRPRCKNGTQRKSNHCVTVARTRSRSRSHSSSPHQEASHLSGRAPLIHQSNSSSSRHRREKLSRELSLKLKHPLTKKRSSSKEKKPAWTDSSSSTMYVRELTSSTPKKRWHGFW